jgi:hypothetical protein
VKSAPELWAELSDPAALARHLGELGEIRITRVEPEQEIEWEAPEATGKVHLKSSGWGTRVTLTLTRDAGADPTDDAASDAQDPDRVRPPDESEPRDDDEAGMQALGEAACAGEPQTMSDLTRGADPEPAAHVPVPEVPVETGIAAWLEAHEHESGAAATLASEPPGETALASQTEPPVVSEPEAPDASELDGDASLEASFEPEHDASDEASADAWSLGVTQSSPGERAPELLPRRGFLARIVGRLRASRELASRPEPDPFQGLALVSGRATGWSAPSAPDASAHTSPLDASTARSDDPPETLEPRDPDAALTPRDDGEQDAALTPSDHREHAAPAPLDDLESEPLEHTVSDRAGLASPAAESPAAETADAEAETEAETVAEAESTEPEPSDDSASPARPQTIAAGAAWSPLRAEPEPHDRVAPDPPTGEGADQDGAGEAESAPVAEDEEVLRSVLDRLGAAHHRPFSRA